jgi:phosphotransferase system enzyme I (PtsP)
MTAKVKTGSRTGQRPARQALRLLEDIGAVITEAPDAQAALRRIVHTIADDMSMEVCSIYLYDREQRTLTLAATRGLDPSSVGHVSMSVDEGLTGIAVQSMEPVMAVDALAHPRYKYFPETGEERYHSFLGVPVVGRGRPLGVLIVQTSRRRRFTLAEVRLFKAIAVHLSGVLAQVRLRARLATTEEERLAYEGRMREAMDRLAHYEPPSVQRPAIVPGARARITGFGAAPGFGTGRAHLLTTAVKPSDFPAQRRVPPGRERRRLHQALRRAAQDLERTKTRICATVPEVDGAIFDSQKLMLEDPSFVGRAEELIQDGSSAEAAVDQTVTELVAKFDELDNAYMKERSSDVCDIGQRVIRRLLGIDDQAMSLKSAVVLVAGDVALSDLAVLEHDNLKAIVLASGGVTSHASILAKSLEIPTVVGVEHAEEAIRQNDQLIVDGNAGVVYVNPTAEVLREYDRLRREYSAFNRDLESLRDLPAVTPDGHRVHLSANIGLLSDLNMARLHGADGVGLYRTEVPFISHRDFLGEEEQVALYNRVVEGMGGKPVTIRTLDLGADKYPRYLRVPREDNPFLGWRSIRISLELPQLFKEQLRAIWRVSHRGPVRIMFPMISSLDEIRQVKELLGEARDEAEAAGHALGADMSVGMMLEVPAAMHLAAHFAEEVDFFSIGTNDLIQYVLAVDRNNRKVGPLYQPLHPAVLQCLAGAVTAAKEAGRSVSLCGEMATDPACSLILIGLGIDELSMGPFFIPVIKRVIRSVDFSTARQLATDVLELATVKEVKGRVFEFMRDLGMIDIMEMYH